MALRDDIRNAMRNAGFDPDDTTSATSPKYNARLFETIAGVVRTEMAGSIDWSTLTEYETPGTRTVTVPSNCDKIIVFAACGGGAGGSSSNGSSTPMSSTGASGGSIINKVYRVSPNQSLSLTVGTGGAGGTYSRYTDGTAAGKSGSATSISGIFTCTGGTGASSSQSYIAGAGGTPNGRPGSNDGTSLFGSPSLIGWGGGGWYGNSNGPTPGIRGGGGGGGNIDTTYANRHQGSKGGDGYICFAFIRKA